MVLQAMENVVLTLAVNLLWTRLASIACYRAHWWTSGWPPSKHLERDQSNAKCYL